MSWSVGGGVLFWSDITLLKSGRMGGRANTRLQSHSPPATTPHTAEALLFQHQSFRQEFLKIAVCLPCHVSLYPVILLVPRPSVCLWQTGPKSSIKDHSREKRQELSIKGQQALRQFLFFRLLNCEMHNSSFQNKRINLLLLTESSPACPLGNRHGKASPLGSYFKWNMFLCGVERKNLNS